MIYIQTEIYNKVVRKTKDSDEVQKYINQAVREKVERDR